MQTVDVRDEGAMNESYVRKWCRLFKEGKTNVNDEERSGKLSTILRTFPALHYVIITCFSTSKKKNLWPPRVCEVTDRLVEGIRDGELVRRRRTKPCPRNKKSA